MTRPWCSATAGRRADAWDFELKLLADNGRGAGGKPDKSLLIVSIYYSNVVYHAE